MVFPSNKNLAAIGRLDLIQGDEAKTKNLEEANRLREKFRKWKEAAEIDPGPTLEIGKKS